MITPRPWLGISPATGSNLVPYFGLSEVGLRRGAGITPGPFPQAAYPNPACQSPGTGLSTCLAH